jgi:hypothetical protein
LKPCATNFGYPPIQEKNLSKTPQYNKTPPITLGTLIIPVTLITLVTLPSPPIQHSRPLPSPQDTRTSHIHTPRRVHICYVGIMRGLPRPQRDPRWTADRRRAVVLPIVSSPVQQVFPHQRHVVQRRQVRVLIIRQHEHDVRSLLLAPILSSRASSEWFLVCGICRQGRAGCNCGQRDEC